MSTHEPEHYRKHFYLQLARLAKALSNDKRLEILDVLAQGERGVDSLATELDIPLSNTSHHLHKLAQAGLVTARKSGIRVYYRLADEEAGQLTNLLAKMAQKNVLAFEQLVATYLTRRDEMEPIGAQELLQRLQEGSVTVIDTRPAEEFTASHLPGAINLPFWEIDPERLPMDRDSEIVAYCRGPYCILSFEATAILRGLGFKVRRYADGFPDWKARGFALSGL